MNNTLDIIKKRRTTRKFKQEQIKDEEIQAIIQAGLYAPSAHNQQSWHFTVVQNKELIQELNAATKNELKNLPEPSVQNMANNKDFDIFYGAPTVVIISGENTAILPYVDCAAATENMFIAAESLEIGGCWNGFVGYYFSNKKDDEIKNKLNIPEGYTPYYAAVFGYIEARGTNAPARKENKVNYIK